MGLKWSLQRVLPDEQGVVLRFGKFIKTTQPGLNYHIPFPVEKISHQKLQKLIELMLDLGQQVIPEDHLELEMFQKKV